MQKSIHTLIPDIYELLSKKGKGFEAARHSALCRSYESAQSKKEEAPRLRLSQMGPRCPRALFYSIHHPELAEKLPPWAEMKYLYGHIIEALVVELAKAAGHTVEGEQHEVSVDGIKGHIDCIIDGCLVDIKSSSSRGFTKFKDGRIVEDDSFGYLDQLDGYLVGCRELPFVTNKEKGYLLAVDKQLGHMHLYEHIVRQASIQERIKQYKEIVSKDQPPTCTCGTRLIGKSGNVGLDLKASYSLYKHCCFPNLRTFIYADGPVYLTHVERIPDVPELRK